MRILIAAAAASLIAAGALAAGPPGPPREPVMVGGHDGLDACMTQGQVSGLNPNGDGFLSVREGPSTKHVRIDKIFEGQSLYLCDERDGWFGVVYSGEEGLDCGTSSPIEPRQVYDGPCNAGWVSARYVEILAG